MSRIIQVLFIIKRAIFVSIYIVIIFVLKNTFDFSLETNPREFLWTFDIINILMCVLIAIIVSK